MRAVVRGDQVVAQLDRPHPLDDLGDEQRVAERLAHLLAGRGDPARCASSTGRTAGRPRVDWASSFSWCGKRRSSPPPWMSNSAPRYLPAIAEHSRCQPGRPRPHGVGQDAPGSPALAPFHSAKSRGSRLPRGSASVGRLHLVELLAGQRAVRRPGAHVEVDVAGAVLGRRRRARARSASAISSTISGTWPVARGSYVGGAAAQHVVRPRATPARWRRRSAHHGTPGLGRLGQDLVVDVGDVGDEGDLVARGAPASAAARRRRPPSGCARCAARPAP